MGPTRSIVGAAMMLAALTTSAGCYRGLDQLPGGSGDDSPPTAGGADEDGDAGEDSGDDEDGSAPQLSECRASNYEVFVRLESACAGCHSGPSSPLMSDFAAFEQLVIGNTDLVVAGDPDASGLLELLTGNAAPPLDQMPPGASSFAELSDRGETEITIEELEAWILDMEPCDVPGGSLSPRYARRAGARQIQRSLFEQLDLTLDDVSFNGYLPLDEPTFPEFFPGDISRGPAHERWAALGGPHYLRGNVANEEYSPLFIQTLGPMAQSWCRRSIVLDRPALFRHVTRDSNSATEAEAIRDNIRYLYLRLLGIAASDEQVEDLYTQIYLHYEASEDSRVAWTAVCSSLIRHPLWSSY